MAEFSGCETKYIKTEEPIIFENNTDHDFDVDVGVIFHKSGIYEVSLLGNRTIVSEIPKRKTGYWYCSDDMYETAVCSCCKWDSEEPLKFIKMRFRYCPNCGSYNGKESTE